MSLTLVVSTLRSLTIIIDVVEHLLNAPERFLYTLPQKIFATTIHALSCIVYNFSSKLRTNT